MTRLPDVINLKTNNAGAMEALAKGVDVMEELKPCPFCGKSELHVEKSIDVIYCKTCGAEMDTERGDWNRRPIEDALRAQLASRDALIERLVEAGDGLICGGAMMDIEMAKLENVWRDTVAEWQEMKGGEE